MATTDRTKNDWIAALEQANAGREESPPDGFLLVDEMVRRFGLSKRTMERQIPILLETDKLVVGYYKRITRGGQLRKLPHYKLKK